MNDALRILRAAAAQKTKKPEKAFADKGTEFVGEVVVIQDNERKNVYKRKRS